MLERPEQFNVLLDRVFEFAQQIMDMELDPDDRNFARVMIAKQQVMTSMLSLGARVDSGSMRSKATDKLGSLLDDIKSANRQRATEVTRQAAPV